VSKARCSVLNRIVHSSQLLDPTPARLKPASVGSKPTCVYQCHASRVSILLLLPSIHHVAALQALAARNDTLTVAPTHHVAALQALAARNDTDHSLVFQCTLLSTNTSANTNSSDPTHAYVRDGALLVPCPTDGVTPAIVQGGCTVLDFPHFSILHSSQESTHCSYRFHHKLCLTAEGQEARGAEIRARQGTVNDLDDQFVLEDVIWIHGVGLVLEDVSLNSRCC
jgi:hypothetical protein